MIITSYQEKDETHYYTEYQTTNEYIEDSMQVFLESTVPRVEYNSNSGSKFEFVDFNFKQLIIEDLQIRQLEEYQTNISSLEQGIENEIIDALDSIFQDTKNQDYVFICSYSTDTNDALNVSSKIVISNSFSPSQKIESEALSYEKSILPDGMKNSGSENDEIIVQIYLV